MGALLVALQRVHGTRGESGRADSRTVAEVVAHVALLWLRASVIKGKPEKRGQCMEAMCGLVQTCKAAGVGRYTVCRGAHLLLEVGGVPLEPGVKIGRIGVGQGRGAASEAELMRDRAKTGFLNMLIQHIVLAVRVEFHAQGGLVSE